MLLFFLSPKCILSLESSIDINDATPYDFPYRLGEDYEKVKNSKFTRNGKPIKGAEDDTHKDHRGKQLGLQTLNLEIYRKPTNVNTPWNHPKHFFQALNGIVDGGKLDAFVKKIKDNNVKEPISKIDKENFFKDHVRPKILKELKKTKCFFKRKSTYEIGNNMTDCAMLTDVQCKVETNCEPNEIIDITIIGDSFEVTPEDQTPKEADKFRKVNDAIKDEKKDIENLRTKYRRAMVWSDKWFRASNGFSSNSGWFYNKDKYPDMSPADNKRLNDESTEYFTGQKNTSQLMQGLPEIHLDTFVGPLKDYIEHGYGLRLHDGTYQGHTLNFWMPLKEMSAAPLGFVNNEQTKFEVGAFTDGGSGWLFDTEFKKHTMISAIHASNNAEDQGKKNHRQSLEFRFDLHFKNEPTERDAVPAGLLLKESRQSFLAPDSE